MSYSENKEEETEGGGFGEKLSGLKEDALPKILANKRKILLGLVILVLLVWYAFFRPVPGTLNVNVVELDSNEAIVGAQVDVVDANTGMLVKTDYADDNGRVTLSGLPTRTALRVDVLPDPGHKTASKSVEIESGGSESLTVKVGKNWDLSVEAKRGLTGSIGGGCSQTIEFEVTNHGDAAVAIEFVGDGDLEGLVSSTEKVLNPKTKETVEVKISAPATTTKTETKTGKARVKYTNKGASLEFDVVEQPKISLSPGDVKEKLSAGEDSFTEIIEVSLSSKQAMSLDVGCVASGKDLEGRVRINELDERPLTTGNPKVFKIEFGTFDAGRYVGKIVCDTSCGEQSVLVDVEKTG